MENRISYRVVGMYKENYRMRKRVIRLEDQCPAKVILVAIVEGRRLMGTPRLMWKDGMAGHVKLLGERN